MDRTPAWSCWQLHHSKQKGRGRPITPCACRGRWTFVFLYLSTVLSAELRPMCCWHKLRLRLPLCLQGSDHLHVKYNHSRRKHENRFNKEYLAFPWPEKPFCHALSTLILALGRLRRLYSVWQRRARDSFSWHPGTSPHWHSPLKCHINSHKVLPYQKTRAVQVGGVQTSV